MLNVTLLSQRVQEIHFVNHIETSGKIELANSFNFHVNFSDDNRSCRAQLYQSAKMKDDPDRLFISGEIVGFFRVDGMASVEDKRAVHIQCYNQLFPYLQSMLSFVAAGSGLPGFLIQKRAIDPNQIVLNPAASEESLPIV